VCLSINPDGERWHRDRFATKAPRLTGFAKVLGASQPIIVPDSP